MKKKIWKIFRKTSQLSRNIFWACWDHIDDFFFTWPKKCKKQEKRWFFQIFEIFKYIPQKLFSMWTKVFQGQFDVADYDAGIIFYIWSVLNRLGARKMKFFVKSAKNHEKKDKKGFFDTLIWFLNESSFPDTCPLLYVLQNSF